MTIRSFLFWGVDDDGDHYSPLPRDGDYYSPPHDLGTAVPHFKIWGAVVNRPGGQKSNPTRVRPEDFHAVLRKAGLTERTLAEQLGVRQQTVDRMIHGRSPASPRFVRDVGLVLGERLAEDPDLIRGVVFIGSAVVEPGPSVLATRIASLTAKEVIADA